MQIMVLPSAVIISIVVQSVVAPFKQLCHIVMPSINVLNGAVLGVVMLILTS